MGYNIVVMETTIMAFRGYVGRMEWKMEAII